MGDYSLYLLFALAIAGITAALIVWAFPGTNDLIGFLFAIAGVVLALAGIVLSLLL
jgi:hypothetical protein